MWPFDIKKKQEQRKKKILLSTLMPLGCLVVTAAVVVPVVLTQCNKSPDEPMPKPMTRDLLINGYSPCEWKSGEYYYIRPQVTVMSNNLPVFNTAFTLEKGHLPNNSVFDPATGAIAINPVTQYDWDNVTIRVTSVDYPHSYGSTSFKWTIYP